MSGVALENDLQSFSVGLFERSGGIAEWPDPDEPGSAVVPPELASAAELPGEEFYLGREPEPGTLQVGLGSEFLDIAARVLDVAVPRGGSFCIPERYLTSRDLSDKIAKTFGWQNARCKCRKAEPAVVEYHLWTLLGTLRSEDVWESLFRVAVNAESQSVVTLPDVFHEPDIEGDAADQWPAADEPGTYETAVAEGKRQMMAASAGFVSRIEQRLERDRKRLQDYYRALSHEAGGSKRRTAKQSSPEEIAAKKRAVDLELRRKLSELNENYALEAVMQPVVLARVRLPALVVPAVIQRKQATREYPLYWNSLQKQFEPLSCHRCRRATFSATFTNETVDLLCSACVAESRR